MIGANSDMQRGEDGLARCMFTRNCWIERINSLLMEDV